MSDGAIGTVVSLRASHVWHDDTGRRTRHPRRTEMAVELMASTFFWRVREKEREKERERKRERERTRENKVERDETEGKRSRSTQRDSKEMVLFTKVDTDSQSVIKDV